MDFIRLFGIDKLDDALSKAFVQFILSSLHISRPTQGLATLTEVATGSLLFSATITLDQMRALARVFMLGTFPTGTGVDSK